MLLDQLSCQCTRNTFFVTYNSFHIFRLDRYTKGAHRWVSGYLPYGIPTYVDLLLRDSRVVESNAYLCEPASYDEFNGLDFSQRDNVFYYHDTTVAALAAEGLTINKALQFYGRNIIWS